MVIFTLVLVVVLVSMAGLAAGVVLGRGPLQGTCSGAACKARMACAGCKRRAGAGDGT